MRVVPPVDMSSSLSTEHMLTTAHVAVSHCSMLHTSGIETSVHGQEDTETFVSPGQCRLPRRLCVLALRSAQGSSSSGVAKRTGFLGEISLPKTLSSFIISILSIILDRMIQGTSLVRCFTVSQIRYDQNKAPKMAL